jgi:thiamine-monophosphate kinase
MPDGTRRLGEFELIAALLAPLSREAPGAFGLTDDAAVITPPAGHDMVVTKDMMVSGVHFLPDDPPDLIARKLLRVNLSDLAAMGVSPYGYALGLSLPAGIGDDWLTAFAAGLAADQQAFGVVLLGGDTTLTPGPLTLSLTAFGFTPHGRLLRRVGARPGDGVFVTGTIGDAALGLLVLQRGMAGEGKVLAGRYRLPTPRCSLGILLPGVATAGLDVSDGLVGDLGHLCTASGVGAIIRADKVPLSPEARRLLDADRQLLETILTGGDDYELVFTVPPDREADLAGLAARTGVPITRIGRIVSGAGVAVEDASGVSVPLTRVGFRHR